MTQFTISTDDSDVFEYVLQAHCLADEEDLSAVVPLLRLIRRQIDVETFALNESIAKKGNLGVAEAKELELIRRELTRLHRMVVNACKKRKELDRTIVKKIEEERVCKAKEKARSEEEKARIAEKKKREEYIAALSKEDIERFVCMRISGLQRLFPDRPVRPEHYDEGLNSNYPNAVEVMMRLGKRWEELIEECAASS